MLSLVSILLLCQMTSAYPTVLMHGVLASKENMAELKSMLELNFKIDVYNMEIGNGVIHRSCSTLYTCKFQPSIWLK